MGQKVHPGGMRVGVIHDWKSNWWTGKKEFPAYLIEDIRIREHIYKKLSHAGLSDILIRKDKQRITVDIYTARPGIVIGKSGVEVDALRKELHAITGKNVHININEIKRPELDAKLVAQSIAEQLQNRVSFRRAMKRSLASAIRSGAQGIKITCGGRLGGAEMSRSETYSEGRVPLHTIRADIDYGFVEAKTTFGRIGVKVWINKGEIMPEGYGGASEGTRLGEQDQARRRGGALEGLGASRESRAAAARTARASGRSSGAAGRRTRGARKRSSARRRRPRPRARRRASSSRHRRPPAQPEANRAPEPKSRPAAGRRGARHDAGAGRAVERRREKKPPPDEAEGHRVDAPPEEDEVPQVAARPQARPDEGPGHGPVRRLRPQGTGAAWLTNREIEAARIAMTRKIKRGGKVWINLFPDKPVTKKPAETRMGKGKGSPETWVAVVKPGRVMFELSGVPEPLAKEALRLAGNKLSVKTKIVKREADLFES